MGEQTRRELLEAAFEEAETPETPETPAAPEGGTEYEVEAKAAKEIAAKPVADETLEIGKPAEGKPAEKPVEGKPAEKPAEGKPAAEKPAEQAGAGQPIKAPISWKAEEKAAWSKIPPIAQAAIARRELETMQVLSRSGQARRFVDEFTQTVSPFAHLIRAQASTPLAAVRNLMTTAAHLMTGDPQQKARVIADIIANYAIDVNVLDQVLAQAQQQGVPATYGQGVLPPQFAAALKPVYDFMGTVEQRRLAYEQQMDEQAVTDTETFGANKPFFEELRDEMADIMEFAVSKGRKMTMEQAYQRALTDHPEMSSQINGARTPTDVSAAASTLARARRAAKPVRGAPAAGGGGKPTPTTRREAISQAWEDNERS